MERWLSGRKRLTANEVSRKGPWVRIPPSPFTLSEYNEAKGHMWYFYIARCKDNSLYSGITNDLVKRIVNHNKGKGAKYTFARRPAFLVYSEKHKNISSARKREEQIKRWSKIKKEKLIMGFPRLRSE